MSNFNGGQPLHGGNMGTQSQGPGTGRGATQVQPIMNPPQHSSSQANLHSGASASATIIEERIKHQNGEVSYR